MCVCLFLYNLYTLLKQNRPINSRLPQYIGNEGEMRVGLRKGVGWGPQKEQRGLGCESRRCDEAALGTRGEPGVKIGELSLS